MPTVYVLNKDGKPLMPTTRCMHVRHLLKNGKARVVKSKPFTIQLLYETDDVVQPLYLGIDPGRTNIGVAVVKADGAAVFTAHLETRNRKSPNFANTQIQQGADPLPSCLPVLIPLPAIIIAATTTGKQLATLSVNGRPRK